MSDKRKSLVDALTNNSATNISPQKYKIQKDRQENRKNKKVIAGFFDRAVAVQLKKIAAEEDTSIQNLLAEAINHIFEKRKLPIIA